MKKRLCFQIVANGYNVSISRDCTQGKSNLKTFVAFKNTFPSLQIYKAKGRSHLLVHSNVTC